MQPGAMPSYEPGYAADPGYAASAYAAPGYAAPVSGPPPFSGPPAGMPYSGPPAGPYTTAGPAPARGRPIVPILAITAALLFVLGGVMTGLFIWKSGELDSTRKDLTAQVEERDTTIDTKNGEITKLQGDLDKAQDDLDKTKQTLTGTQNDRDQVEKEKQVIARCLTLFSQSMDAAVDGDRATVNRLSGELEKACTEAEKYV
jgi:hypothetical protein